MTTPSYSVFKAIAEPTRREIIHLLVNDSALTINEICDRFSSSRQAITKHIKLLHSAGLLKIEQQGRKRICHFDHRPLREVHQWLATFERFWTDRLEALDSYLDQRRIENNDE